MWDAITSMHMQLHILNSWILQFGKMEDRNHQKSVIGKFGKPFVQNPLVNASSFALNMELEDGLPINRITKEAFNILVWRGIIWADWKSPLCGMPQTLQTSGDHISFYTPAATVGMDENTQYLHLKGYQSYSASSKFQPATKYWVYTSS